MGIKFLHEFSIGAYNLMNPGDNVISVTGTAPGDFSKTNLTTTALRESWRSAAVDVVQRIVIQANNTANPIDCFAILNHNFTEDAIITLQANTVDNWSAPPFSHVLAWNEKHIIYNAQANSAYEYWRVSVLDPGNACGFLEIGRLVGGTCLSMDTDDGEDITDDITVSQDDLAYQMKTEGFFRASNERVQIEKLSIKFDRIGADPAASRTNYLALKAMFREVGTTFPFLTIVDSSDPYFILIWGQFTNMPTRTYGINRYASTSLSVEEVF